MPTLLVSKSRPRAVDSGVVGKFVRSSKVFDPPERNIETLNSGALRHVAPEASRRRGFGMRRNCAENTHAHSYPARSGEPIPALRMYKQPGRFRRVVFAYLERICFLRRYVKSGEGSAFDMD